MNFMWRAILDDMINSGMTEEEARQVLEEEYPDTGTDDGIEMPLTDSLDQPTVRSFCKAPKRAQMMQPGYPEGGLQSNFSVPNSEGEVGPGMDIRTEEHDKPDGSYLERVRVRKQMKELKDKEKDKKSELLNRLCRKAQQPPQPQPPAPPPPPPPESNEQAINQKTESLEKLKGKIKEVKDEAESFKQSLDFLK